MSEGATASKAEAGTARRAANGQPELRLSALELARRCQWNAFESDPEALRATVRARNEWWLNFIASNLGRRALERFEAARPHAGKRTLESVKADHETIHRIAEACHYAATWQAADDEGAVYRKSITEARNVRDKLRNHARELAQGFAKRLPGHWSALREAAHDAGVGSKGRKEPRELVALWCEFFEALQKNLEGKLPEIDGGPWHYLYRSGNMWYPKRIMRRTHEIGTMLAFELVIYLRNWTAGRASVLGKRKFMPKDGRPRYGVAAAFVNAALSPSNSLIGEDIENRLKRIPRDVCLMGWDHKPMR